MEPGLGCVCGGGYLCRYVGCTRVSVRREYTSDRVSAEGVSVCLCVPGVSCAGGASVREHLCGMCVNVRARALGGRGRLRPSVGGLPVSVGRCL